MQAALELLNVGLADSAAVPTYVLLITDGQPNCGAGGTETTTEDVTAVDDVLDALLAADIKTFVIGYDMANNPALAANMGSSRNTVEPNTPTRLKTSRVWLRS